jgi:hypothetical protein
MDYKLGYLSTDVAISYKKLNINILASVALVVIFDT